MTGLAGVDTVTTDSSGNASFWLTDGTYTFWIGDRQVSFVVSNGTVTMLNVLQNFIDGTASGGTPRTT